MEELQFAINIHASKQDIWRVLWSDVTFRLWAGIIDPGTYMVGELEEGHTVQFISSENGYGVTSLVEKVAPNEYLLLRHRADTQSTGLELREEEWTGGSETYLLEEKGDKVHLTVTFDVPSEQKRHFEQTYPLALEKVKELAEGTKLI